MEAIILFLLKSIIVSGVLTAWYQLALRGRRLHQYNRFFLLTNLFVSLSVPFLNFQLYTIPNTTNGRFAPIASFIQAAGDNANIAPVTPQTGQSPIQWQAVAGMAAGCISLMLLSVLILRVVKVQRMRKQHAVTQLEGVDLVLTDSPAAPFSFLKSVFWNKSIPLNDEVGRLILRHELAHITHGHTYDKLVCQLLTCIFWFNPFYWIIQKELNIVHEFVADEQAVENRDTEVFARMVLQSYNNGSYLVPQHHFFSSTIKRRLVMLQNASQPSFAFLRRIVAMPIIVGTVVLFSFACSNNAAINIVPAKKKIVLLIDAAHGGQDAGSISGSYSEKDICLKYAKRIKELAPAYNIEVRLTREDDKTLALADRVAISDEVHPDVFISLHVGDEPGKDKAKGDFEIYVSSQSKGAGKSSRYSSGIFGAMSMNGVIPGTSSTTNHIHSPGCACDNCNQTKIAPSEKGSIYVLKNAQVPAMVMILGNIKNKVSMEHLSDNSQMDVLCNSILKGIVDGSTEKDELSGTTMSLLGAQGDGKCR